jgi:hypothetical protein
MQRLFVFLLLCQISMAAVWHATLFKAPGCTYPGPSTDDEVSSGLGSGEDLTPRDMAFTENCTNGPSFSFKLIKGDCIENTVTMLKYSATGCTGPSTEIPLTSACILVDDFSQTYIKKSSCDKFTFRGAFNLNSVPTNFRFKRRVAYYVGFKGFYVTGTGPALKTFDMSGRSDCTTADEYTETDTIGPNKCSSPGLLVIVNKVNASSSSASPNGTYILKLGPFAGDTLMSLNQLPPTPDIKFVILTKEGDLSDTSFDETATKRIVKSLDVTLIAGCSSGTCLPADGSGDYITQSTTAGPSTTTAAPKASTCFPADAVVETKTGMKTMAALKVGEIVRVSADNWSEVYFFSHQERNAVAEFVSILTDTGARIQLTSGHYIYADGMAVQARLVGVGDKLSNGTVVAVDRIKAVGLYNPHTLQGDLLVNGIVASSYTDAIPPLLAHSLLAPLRIMYGRKEFSGL